MADTDAHATGDPADRDDTEPVAEPRRARRPRLEIKLADRLALAPEWAAMAPGPFHHPAWHDTWLRHFGVSTEPVFLSVRAAPARRSADSEGAGDAEGAVELEEQEGELAAVIALDLAGPPRELGDHNVRDYAGPCVAPGHEPETAALLLEWLSEDFSTSLDLWGLREDSAFRAALAHAAESHGWSYMEEVEAVSPAATLPGGWETFVDGLGKRHRHELRRKLRHLEAAGRCSFAAVTAPGEVASGMDRLLAMMRASSADKAAFLAPEMEAFFRDLAVTFAELGMTRLATLRLGDDAVATLLSFEHAGTEYLYNSGYDPDHAPLAVGLLSKAFAMRGAIERGLKTFDFLRGDEDYKRHLGGQAHPIFRAALRRER